MLNHFIKGPSEAAESEQTVLLLHGFLGSGRNLTSLATRLSERLPRQRFIVPDLTGHGVSPGFSGQPSIAAIAADVWALARTSGANKPAVIGHSLGGRVGLAMARHDPQALQLLTLLDIAPGRIGARSVDLDAVLSQLLVAPESTSSRAELKQRFTEQGMPGSLADWVLMNLERRDDGRLYWRFDREALRQLNVSHTAEDLWPVAERVAASLGTRLHLIRGEQSSFVTTDDVQRLRDLGARVDALPSGHFVHVDTLDPLVELLVADLSI